MLGQIYVHDGTEYVLILRHISLLSNLTDFIFTERIILDKF